MCEKNIMFFLFILLFNLYAYSPIYFLILRVQGNKVRKYYTSIILGVFKKKLSTNIFFILFYTSYDIKKLFYVIIHGHIYMSYFNTNV